MYLDELTEAKQIIENLARSFEVEGFTISERDKKRLINVLLNEVDIDKAVEKYVRRVKFVNKETK